MTCQQCLGIEREFDSRVARGELRRYRRRGAAASTRALIEALLPHGIGDTVLDIGGGVGAIQHALLEAGAATAVSVEASTAYLEAAAEEARRRGLDGRITAIHGDFAGIASQIAPADIVTLDRVICCYHDMRVLVAESARRARRLYGVVYPREAWWLRPALGLVNLVLRIRRSPFRVYLHPTAEVEATIAAAGLRRLSYRHRGMWQVAVFSRPVAA